MCIYMYIYIFRWFPNFSHLKSSTINIIVHRSFISVRSIPKNGIAGLKYVAISSIIIIGNIYCQITLPKHNSNSY